MITNLCFGLTFLLIPLLIELFNLQAGLHLSNFGHSLVEVIIVCLFYWLLMQILRLDDLLYLRNYTRYIHPSIPKKVEHIKNVQPFQRAETEQVKQTRKYIFHDLLMTFGSLFKGHRTAKLL